MKTTHFASPMLLMLAITGCQGGKPTPTQKAASRAQWNDARASVLMSLANEQFRTGTFDKCQETLEQALAITPENASLHLLAAKLQIEQGKLEQAAAQLAEVRRLDPKEAEADYLSGVILQRWQQPRQAADAYGAAVAKDPQELSYLLAESEMLVALDHPQDAVDLLKSRASSFEHSGALRDEIGQILVQMRKYDQAAVWLRAASLLATDDATIREHLGFALYFSGDYTEALDVLDRLSQDPAYLKRADVLGALGDCRGNCGKVPEARAAYEAAVLLAPDCSGYWLGLGRVATQLNDLPRADLAVRRAISLTPGDADAHCLLGYVRIRQQQFSEALAAFQKVALLRPDDSLGLCMQGYVLQRMGKSAEAMKMFTQALRLNPKDTLAGKLMAGS